MDALSQKILDGLGSKPWLIRELSKKIKANPDMVKNRLRVLVKAGLVEKERISIANTCYTEYRRVWPDFVDGDL